MNHRNLQANVLVIPCTERTLEKISRALKGSHDLTSEEYIKLLEIERQADELLQQIQQG